ncbi:MAG: hypothetical protein ABII26_11765 [Pseudomonadota bacterium]
MKKVEYEDGDYNMRWRFCNQTKKFWRKSKEKNELELPSVKESCEDVRPKEDPLR